MTTCWKCGAELVDGECLRCDCFEGHKRSLEIAEGILRHQMNLMMVLAEMAAQIRAQSRALKCLNLRRQLNGYDSFWPDI